MEHIQEEVDAEVARASVASVGDDAMNFMMVTATPSDDAGGRSSATPFGVEGSEPKAVIAFPESVTAQSTHAATTEEDGGVFDSVYGNAAMFPGGALRSSLATLPQYAPKSPPTTPPFSPPPTPPFSPPPSSLVPLAHRSPSDPTTSLRTAATKPHHDEAGEEDDEDDYNIASDLTGTSTAAVSNRSNPLIRTTSEDAQTAEPTLHTLESYNMQASDMVAASTGDTVDNTREEPFPDLEAGGYDAATRPFHPLAFDSLAEDGTHSPRDSEPLPFPSPQHASSMPEDFKVTGSQQSRSPTETKGFKTQQSMPTKLRRQENEDASYFKVRGWNSFGGVNNLRMVDDATLPPRSSFGAALDRAAGQRLTQSSNAIGDNSSKHERNISLKFNSRNRPGSRRVKKSPGPITSLQDRMSIDMNGRMNIQPIPETPTQLDIGDGYAEGSGGSSGGGRRGPNQYPRSASSLERRRRESQLFGGSPSKQRRFKRVASVAFINRNRNQRIMKEVQKFCQRQSISLKPLDWQRVKTEDNDTLEELLKADMLVVDFGQNGDGALFLSGLIAQRTNKANLLMFEPENVKSQIQASALHMVSPTANMGGAAETLRYTKKKGRGAGMVVQFENGHEEGFAEYLDKKYVDIAAQLTGSTANELFWVTYEAAKSLVLEKIREAENVMIEEEIQTKDTLDVESIQHIDMVLRLYRQIGRHGEVIRLSRMITEHFPGCPSFQTMEAEALNQLGGYKDATDALEIAKVLVATEPNSVKAKMIKGQIHITLLGHALDQLNDYKDVVLTDYDQYEEKAKVLATFTSHCLHAIQCMDEVYHMESTYDVESPPTLAAGHLTCALFCRALALEEEAALANAPIPTSDIPVFERQDTTERRQHVSGVALEAGDNLSGSTAPPMLMDMSLEVIRSKVETLIFQLNTTIGGYGLVPSTPIGGVGSSKPQADDVDTAFEDAVCLFEVNLVGIHLCKEEALYKYVNRAAEKIYEQGSNDIELKSTVQMLKLISRVQTRRTLVHAVVCPDEIRASDEEAESTSLQKQQFTFWCRFLASPAESGEECISKSDTSSCTFKTGAKVPVLLVQENTEELVPCYVSIELPAQQELNFEESQSIHSSLDSQHSVQRNSSGEHVVHHPSMSEVRRNSRTHAGAKSGSRNASLLATSNLGFFGEPAVAPSFVQIVHAFGDSKYILPIIPGELKLQNMDVPLTGMKRNGRIEVDKRQLILSKSMNTPEHGPTTQVCTLMFCSPKLRTGFRAWCTEHGLDHSTQSMQATDGKCDGNWDFDYKPDGITRKMLGRGSFARVFSGKLDKRQPIAIKELINYEVPSVRTSFQNEIRTLNQMNHENIIKSYGWDDSKSEAPCLLLQLVPGGNLQDLVRLYGPIVDPECRESENPGENLVAWYAVQLCRAVEYLHGKQIMSRDIKDENCMVNQYDGTLVLIDFGTHKDMSDIQPVTASFAGTPMTMSKARLTNKPYGIEEDIYSVGETIRGLCGATNKFEGNLNEFRVFRNDHTSMDSINTDWPDAIKAFLKACFADVKVRPSASKLLSDQELFCTQKLRAFDSAAKAAAVSTTTLSPGKAADHVVRMDTATTTAWSQVQPRKQITRNFIALLTEEESVVCELWAGSIGRGLQAVTPRIIPGAAHVPSYFNELLKICRKIIESFAYRKQEVLPWATQEIGKILDSQETSQFELEQTLRLFAFKINEQGGLNTSGGFGGQAAKPHAHFLIPMLREPSAGFHAHQIFHIRKLCDQATEQVLGCLKAATKKHIASSAPLRTPAFALKAGGPSIRRGGGRGMGTRKKSGNTLTVPDGGGGGGSGSGEVPRESSLGARRGLSPSGLSLSTLSTGTSDSLDAGSGPLPTPNIYDGGGDGGGGGADHGAAAQFSEGGPSRAQPFSMGMSDVGMLLERVVETGELLTKIVGDLMAARSHSGGSSGDDSGIEGPRRGKKKKAASNVVDPGGLLYAFIVIELKLPESCATMLLNEEITLDILLEDITRDDLVAVGLAIGPRAKIWAEICKERKAPGRRGSSLQSRQSLTTLGGGGGGGGPAHTAVKTAFSTNTNTIVEILDEKADVVQMNMEDLHEIPIQTQKAKSFEFLPQPQSSGTASRGSLQQARALSQERARNEGSASARKPDGELAGTDRGTLQLDLGGGAALGGTSSSDGAGSKVEASVELRGSDASMVFPAAGGGGSGSVGGDGGGGGGGGGGGAEGEAHEASSVTMRGSSESGVTALRVHSSFEYSPEETEFIIEERLSAPDSVALAASATKFRESMGSASNVLVENFVIEDDGKAKRRTSSRPTSLYSLDDRPAGMCSDNPYAMQQDPNPPPPEPVCGFMSPPGSGPVQASPSAFSFAEEDIQLHSPGIPSLAKGAPPASSADAANEWV